MVVWREAGGMRSGGALAATVSVVSVLLVSVPLSAQGPSWPTKRVQIVVPFAAGSATDLLPRVVFEQVSAKLGQSFIVENKPGGAGSIGVSFVAKADPDGYTILVHSNSFVTTPAIQTLPYDPAQDFAGITPLGSVPMVLVVSPQKGIKTLQGLVAHAKSNPGSFNYAAAGIGSPPHLTMERFRFAAGFQGQLVPFRGAAEALTEVIAGRVDTYFSPLSAAIGFIQDGRLLPLAVSNAKRASALPDVPTTLESGFADSDFDFWVGMMVPKRTPRDLVARIHEVTVRGLEGPVVKEKFDKLGAQLMIMTPEAFDQRIAREAQIALTLAKALGIAAK